MFHASLGPNTAEHVQMQYWGNTFFVARKMHLAQVPVALKCVFVLVLEFFDFSFLLFA